MKKKIIIFGATGNTGAYLTEYCLKNLDLEKYEIIAVGRRKTNFFNRYNIEYYQVDITNKDEFQKLPKENIYGVILLSAELPAYMEGYHPEKYISTNIIGAYNVLEYCRHINADRILYPQTEGDLSEYWGKKYILDPDLPRQFNFMGDHAVYVIAKNTAVDLIKHYHYTYGIKSFIFRCPTIYAYTPNAYFYVNGIRKKLAYRQLIENAIAGKDIELWGDPKMSKDIVYVEDFCQLLYKALLVEKEYGFYNVGTGVGTSLQEQIDGIIEVFCLKDKISKIIMCPEKLNSRHFVMNIDNAKEELGYEPKFLYLDYLKEFKKEMELNRFKELRGE